MIYMKKKCVWISKHAQKYTKMVCETFAESVHEWNTIRLNFLSLHSWFQNFLENCSEQKFKPKHLENPLNPLKLYNTYYPATLLFKKIVSNESPEQNVFNNKQSPLAQVLTAYNFLNFLAVFTLHFVESDAYLYARNTDLKGNNEVIPFRRLFKPLETFGTVI